MSNPAPDRRSVFTIQGAFRRAKRAAVLAMLVVCGAAAFPAIGAQDDDDGEEVPQKPATNFRMPSSTFDKTVFGVVAHSAAARSTGSCCTASRRSVRSADWTRRSRRNSASQARGTLSVSSIVSHWERCERAPSQKPAFGSFSKTTCRSTLRLRLRRQRLSESCRLAPVRARLLSSARRSGGTG